jgi:hypothetical protein
MPQGRVSHGGVQCPSAPPWRRLIVTRTSSLAALLLLVAQNALAQVGVDLPTLLPGKTETQNGLWGENPPNRCFTAAKNAVVAEFQGPAQITMIHFALPMSLKLNRDVLLKIYWDGEQDPSVNCPMVDFFCDPAGTQSDICTALTNKRRGWNAYFPMPFRKSARVELVYDGPLPMSNELWGHLPAYSYVMSQSLDNIPENTGYFHACWHQEGLLLGKKEFTALDAKGKGKFVGWNITIRIPGNDKKPGLGGYPVDENEKFYVDGEAGPSVEFQGLEDSFGFSWAFPETRSTFPLTGYVPYFGGAFCYRFFTSDAIYFQRSLRVNIGFGKVEGAYNVEFSKPENRLQMSSTCYWYQTEPHAPLPAMPSAAERAPAPEDPFWPEKEPPLPSAEDLKKRGVKLEMLAGRPKKEVIFAEPGYDAKVVKGDAWPHWPLPTYHTAADWQLLRIELTVPKAAKGTVRLYVLDPDSFQGGRKETITVGGKSSGLVEDFQKGKWIEAQVGPEQTADGKVLIEAKTAKEGANAVISIVEWVAAE